MEEEISLREYIDLFLRRKSLVITIMLISVCIGGFITYKNNVPYVPKYEATLTVGIDCNKAQKEEIQKAQKEKSEKSKKDKDDSSSQAVTNYITYNSATINQDIATKYKNLLTTPVLYESITAQTGIKQKQIDDIIVEQRKEIPAFIDISIIGENPTIVQKVSNVIPEIYTTEMIRVIGVDCVELIYKSDKAKLFDKPLDLTLVITTVGGIVLSIFLVLLLECLNTKIITPDDVEKYWGIPLIGTVPADIYKHKSKHRM